ncbi:MAG: hypothetical protein JWL59_377 [Chthoniobacteraceae bacterium]|nr:hypothetical protein [Chthoniobacteraceae bacterium]
MFFLFHLLKHSANCLQRFFAMVGIEASQRGITLSTLLKGNALRDDGKHGGHQRIKLLKVLPLSSVVSGEIACHSRFTRYL